MTEKKEQHTHHHHNYNLDLFLKELFKWIIILLLVANGISLILSETSNDRVIYSRCVDSCSEKHFFGIDINSMDQTCYLNEFDRTNCIQSCNSLYKSITEVN